MAEEVSFISIREALRTLWVNPSLPTDARFLVCGAVQAAGRRQGDEVFREEIMEAIASHEDLVPEDILEMCESVHVFVFVNHSLRPQYVAIILNQLTSYLNRNHLSLALDFQEKLATIASNN